MKNKKTEDKSETAGDEEETEESEESAEEKESEETDEELEELTQSDEFNQFDNFTSFASGEWSAPILEMTNNIQTADIESAVEDAPATRTSDITGADVDYEAVAPNYDSGYDTNMYDSVGTEDREIKTDTQMDVTQAKMLHPEDIIHDRHQEVSFRAWQHANPELEEMRQAGERQQDYLTRNLRRKKSRDKLPFQE